MRVLRSFKSGSLGIPGLWHSFIDITSAMLAGNGSSRTSSFATSYMFLAVDFVRPPWGFKILRQELSDAL